MANYATLKAAIQQVIKTNGNNEITGALLQQSLLAMINSLGVGYQYAGVAVLTPTPTNPGTPDQNVFYIASEPGTYANFGGLVLADGEVAILKYNGAWSKDSTGAASLENVNQLGQEVSDLDFGLYGDTSHEILDTTNPVIGTLYQGKWIKTGSYWQNAVLPVGAYKGRTLRIIPKSTAEAATYFFTKDNILVDNQNVNFCDGWTSQAYVYVTTDISIPDDAEYMVVRLNNTDTLANVTPQSLLVLGVEGELDKKVDKIPGKSLSENDYTNADKAKVESIPGISIKVEDLDDKINGRPEQEILDTTNPVAGIVYNGKWTTYSTAGYWQNAVLSVSAYKGRTLRITPKSTSYGTTYFFAKDNILVDNRDVNFCDGWSSTFTSVPVDVTIPNDAEYMVVRLNNTDTQVDVTPQSLLVLEVVGELDKKVDKIPGKGLSTNDYTNVDKLKVNTIENYVPKQQGVENAGLLLKVGVDGMVTLGTGAGTQPDVSDCVRKEISKTLFLGENVLSGVVGSGTGWTENSGNYTHATGETAPLEFNYATDDGDAYVAILSYSAIVLNADVLVSIGNGVPCDIYNGTFGPFYVGMISDGGNLKITADSNYNGTITGVELRKVVLEEDADISIILDTSSNKHYENVSAGTMVSNITGWWNVAIGANDALKSNQNGSRNIAIGARSLESMQGGTRNIGIGTFALDRLVYGVGNIAIGADSSWYISQGNHNVAVGMGSLGEFRGNNTNNNVAIGWNALSLETQKSATDNVAIGRRALSGGDSTKDKTNCVAVGASAGIRNNTDCTAIGTNAALYTQGSGNVAIGMNAMHNYNMDGDNNICIGKDAVLYSSTYPATINNAIAIGYGVRVKKSNQVVIGNANNDEFVFGTKKLVFNNDNTVSWETIS